MSTTSTWISTNIRTEISAAQRRKVEALLGPQPDKVCNF